MIKVLNFLVKLIATAIGFLIYLLEILTALIMYEKKFIRNVEFLILVWKKSKI